MSNTTARSAGAALALLLTVTACAGSSEQSGDGAGGPVVVANIPGNMATVTLQVALDQGFFDDAGITVETIDAPVAPEAISGMIGGTSDVSYATPAVLIPAMQQDPDVLAMGPFAAQDYRLAVPEDSPVQSVDELQGATVAVFARGGAVEFFAREVFRTAGIDPESVTYVAGGGPLAQLGAMQRGDYDATVFNPGAMAQVGANGLALRAIATAEDGDAGEFGDVGISTLWATTRDFVEERPDDAEALCQGLGEAATWLADESNREEATAIIAELLGVTPDSAAEVWSQQHDIYRPSIDDTSWEANVSFALAGDTADLPADDAVYGC